MADGPFSTGCRVMKEEDFLKKAGFYCRYLAQFVTEGDVPKILETIKDLDSLRQQAEKEKVE
jgi:hypothetical protein